LLLESRTLAGSEQLRKLLEYLVRNTLEGRTGQLNELAVAENILGRGQDFIALEDSSARKAMSRLRGRLNSYYETEGSRAELRFVIRGYTVRFERFTPRRPRALLLPLDALNFRDDCYLTRELTQDLMLALAAQGTLEMIPWTAAHALARTADWRDCRRLTGVDILIDGTVRRLESGAHQITLMWVNGITAAFHAYFQTSVGVTDRMAVLDELASRISRHCHQDASAARSGQNPSRPARSAERHPDRWPSPRANIPERNADPPPWRRADRVAPVFRAVPPLEVPRPDPASPLPR